MTVLPGFRGTISTGLSRLACRRSFYAVLARVLGSLGRRPWPTRLTACPLRCDTLPGVGLLGEFPDSIDISVPGQPRLKTPPPLFPNINVACSNRRTVARIDVNTRQVVGEYLAAPQQSLFSDPRYGNTDPSRTTVGRVNAEDALRTYAYRVAICSLFGGMRRAWPGRRLDRSSAFDGRSERRPGSP